MKILDFKYRFKWWLLGTTLFVGVDDVKCKWHKYIA